jgi:hypothetical protein
MNPLLIIPAGAPVPSNAYLPSAPLIKAVLIAGTVAMTGISVPNLKPMAPPPSNYQASIQGHADLNAADIVEKRRW